MICHLDWALSPILPTSHSHLIEAGPGKAATARSAEARSANTEANASEADVTEANAANARAAAGTAVDLQAGPITGTQLSARKLEKSYGERVVLQQLDLDVEPGEFVAIVGRSGCGKSTLLRLVAGLEPATSGQLLLDGQPVTGLRDSTRIMFQEARLLPWRSVLDNILLGLPKSAEPRGREVLAQVGLADRADEWPARLSGGQRQRVALARALVHRPHLLLLDEPLGALDALTRIEMHRLIEDLWRAQGFTALLVTHDVQEAVALADRVILLEEGRIALDQRVDLPRPRIHGSPGFAALERTILDRVLGRDVAARA